jgi:disulfide oxidoreductase YuzD
MPYPQNIPSLADIPHMPVVDIAALPSDVLAPLLKEADAALRSARSTRDWLDGALSRKYAEAAAETRRVAGKDTGAARFADGAVTIVADLSKRVDWDQPELAALVERIKADGEDPRQYVDITFKVPERKYAAWPDHIRNAFAAARTVRTGKESFKLILEENIQ